MTKKKERSRKMDELGHRQKSYSFACHGRRSPDGATTYSQRRRISHDRRRSYASGDVLREKKVERDRRRIDGDEFVRQTERRIDGVDGPPRIKFVYNSHRQSSIQRRAMKHESYEDRRPEGRGHDILRTRPRGMKRPNNGNAHLLMTIKAE
nr:hypothetical protein Iba_chr10fCG5220 [Ipomoea batatas]